MRRPISRHSRRSSSVTCMTGHVDRHRSNSASAARQSGRWSLGMCREYYSCMGLSIAIAGQVGYMMPAYGRRMVEWDPHRYIWEQIAQIIAERIESGEYGPHYQLSETRLAGEFGVARMTIRRALRHLRENGFIVTLPGKGSFPVRRDGGDGAAQD